MSGSANHINITSPGWYTLSVNRQQEEQKFNAVKLVNYLINNQDTSGDSNPQKIASLYPIVYFKEETVPQEENNEDNSDNSQQVSNEAPLLARNVQAVATSTPNETALMVANNFCQQHSIDWDHQTIFARLYCTYSYWIYVQSIDTPEDCDCPELEPESQV